MPTYLEKTYHNSDDTLIVSTLPSCIQGCHIDNKSPMLYK